MEEMKLKTTLYKLEIISINVNWMVRVINRVLSEK